jgi:hypothetical protein
VTWVLWRQHRAQGMVTALLLGLFAVLVAVTGVHMAHLYRDATHRCADGNCLLVGSLFQGYGAVVDLVSVSVAVPLALGIVFGSLLVARETDQATHVLAWTQGVTRRHWVVAKVGVALAATIACAAILSGLVTWWSGTPNSLYHNRFEPLKFDTQNLMPVAFAVFALGVGVAAGALIRRSVPAIAATVGGFLAARLLVEIYARPHYVHAVSLLSPLAVDTPVPTGAWVLGSTIIGPTGRAIPGPFDPATVCPDAIGRGSTATCLNQLGYRARTTFQPAGRYWHFQWTEAGIFIAAGVALLVAAAVLTIRRDA